MARTSRRRHTSRMQTVPEVSLTPLIDTVLVLLVIFMITTPIMQNFINIELPTSSTKDAGAQEEKDTAITVNVDKDQNLFINEVPVKKERFFDELEKRLKGAQERVVFVNADRSIPYGTVLQIVDDIKYLGGVKYVALATQNAGS